MGQDSGSELSVLRVDGGGSANDWMMQFQADLLGVPVERPEVVESTAMGAGALAGLALGVWPDLDAFLQGRSFTRFEPRMSEAERRRLRDGWRRAVGTALHWAHNR
jgi:glycerol kinase